MSAHNEVAVIDVRHVLRRHPDSIVQLPQGAIIKARFLLSSGADTTIEGPPEQVKRVLRQSGYVIRELAESCEACDRTPWSYCFDCTSARINERRVSLTIAQAIEREAAKVRS